MKARTPCAYILNVNLTLALSLVPQSSAFAPFVPATTNSCRGISSATATARLLNGYQNQESPSNNANGLAFAAIASGAPQ